ncbi:BI1-like protein [Dishui Lake large algae virus 1]|nr:BI1-like protein [Dishui Lake large algae virus 1]
MPTDMYIPSSLVRPFDMKGGAFTTRRIIDKAPFMGSVIILMIIQLLLTFYVMKKLYTNERFHELMLSNWLYTLLLFITPLVIIIILAFVPMPMYAKLLLFTLFSMCFGVLLSISRRLLNPELVKIALIVTIGVFVSMFVFGMVLAGFGYDVFWLGAILFVALLIALISGIVMIFTQPEQKVVRTRAILIVILFSLYVLYDTNQIIMRDYRNDYVTAAIDYYLDTINLFVFLMEAMSNSS